MHPEYIKAALKARGKTPAQLSRDLALDRRSVSMCLNGNFNSDRIQRAVADFIDLPVEFVFPERYSSAA